MNPVPAGSTAGYVRRPWGRAAPADAERAGSTYVLTGFMRNVPRSGR